MGNIPELSKLEKNTISLCREVGAFIAGEQPKLISSDISAKGLHDYVTYVDKTSEKELIYGLSELLPGSAFLAEEGSVEHVSSEYTWIIDPLDGTTNYIHGLPVYSISVALQKAGRTILGIVLDIKSGECFHAQEGSGAYLNGKPIRVTDTSSLSESLLATGFPYNDFSRQEEYLRLFSELMRLSRGIRRYGSAAIDLAWVACGRFDGFWEYGLKPWDVAAGAYIAKQAGAACSDFTGNNNFLHGREIVCGNINIHRELLTTLKRCFN